MQCIEVEPAVKTVGERSQVPGTILSKVECMIATGHAGLEVALDSVYLLELGQILLLSSGYRGRLMRASHHNNGGEAVQAIGRHGTARSQMRRRPLLYGL